MADSDQVVDLDCVANDPYLSESISSAQVLIAQGSASEAVRILADAFLYLLKHHPWFLSDSVNSSNMLGPRGRDWPQLGANLDFAGHEPTIVY